MSTATPPRPASPLAPPEDVFWEKYSPHYEFPLSSVGSVAMHIGALALFLAALYMLSRLSVQDTTPVPMRAMMVSDDGPEGDGAAGSGGGTPMENVPPHERPMDPMRPVPEPALDVPELKDWLPKVQSDADAPAPVADNAKAIKDMNADLRKALIDGMNKNRGGGPGAGKGTNGVEGDKSGTGGDSASSGKRSLRWDVKFRFQNYADYLAQLKALKAQIGFPTADGRSAVIFRDLDARTSAPFDLTTISGVYFATDKEHERDAIGLGRALGLNYDASFVILIFPKELEEEMARLERAYRNRKESEIAVTVFEVLMRNGKPFLRVEQQIPVVK